MSNVASFAAYDYFPPSAVSDLSAVVSQSAVRIAFSAAGEDGDVGDSPATSYELRFSSTLSPSLPPDTFFAAATDSLEEIDLVQGSLEDPDATSAGDDILLVVNVTTFPIGGSVAFSMRYQSIL